MSPPTETASVLHFDECSPDVAAYATRRGWPSCGRIHLAAAELRFSTDGWRTTRTAPLQYLYDDRSGFLLHGVPPSTEIEYAVRARVAVSHDGFWHDHDSAEVWLTNEGHNYRARSEPVA